jgi:dihydropyrimidine dehydrogenase (NADP+)/dihydropyrimidine dehydrogenase (NAD+) subunit PreA
MPTLKTTVDGITFENPFVIGSGPPGTNEKMIAKAFDEGWGGVVAKTVCLDADTIVNVVPRYGRLKSREHNEVIGFQNIELISDRSFDAWLDEFKSIKDKYPEKVLIASIMEEYNKDRWQEITQRCDETGVDAFELNLSCPHGLPERKMGAAMGQDNACVEEVTRWVVEATDKPVWSKMTPNVTHIADPAAAALRGGAHGVSAINTILAVIGVDLETMRPMPTVEGYTVPGGYSCQAVRPIALRMIMEIARDVPELSISGIGGIECADDAIQFLLMGSSTVQLCTAPMLQGFGMVKELCEGTLAWMEKNGFETIDDFRGHSLQYFSTHADLVERQAAAKAAKKAAREAKASGLADTGKNNLDAAWDGDAISKQTEELTGTK